MNNNDLGKKRTGDILQFVECYGALTISQCASLIYPNAKTAYKIAEKKLAKLVKDHKLSLAQVEKENVYYIDKKLGKHDLFINDFFIGLINSGATNITFEKPKYWLKDKSNNKYKIRSDALFKYDFAEYSYFNILEVCWTNKNIPIKTYEELFKSGEAHQICKGTFPRLIVMDDTKHNPKHFYSDLFKVIQINFNMKDMPLIFVD